MPAPLHVKKVRKIQSSGAPAVYERVFDLETDAVVLPPTWAMSTVHHANDTSTKNWLELVRGNIFCYTNETEPAFPKHVTPVHDEHAHDLTCHIRYIADNYDYLPQYVVFTHFPFDHNQEFLADLRKLIQRPPAAYASLHKYKPLCTADGDLCEMLNPTTVQAWRDKYQRPVRALWCSLFSTPIPPVLTTSFAFLSVVSRDAIRLRSRAFWKNLRVAAHMSGWDHLERYGHNGDGKTTHSDFTFLSIYAYEIVFSYLFDKDYKTWPAIERPA